MPSFHRGIPLAVLAFAAAGCSSSSTTPLEDIREYRAPVDADASPGRTILLSSPDELRLTVRTVGPGTFTSPPEMAGDAVMFTEARLADVQVPAGVTQVFYFLARQRGTSIVRFHGTESSVVITDTLVVR